jgi:tRNA-specific adenosine deaminase 1
MAAQEDATPWEVLRQEGPPSSDAEVSATETLLDGRAHFSLLGVVRRKPARMDAEFTRSKSCSDKLALRQVSSLLSCETSRLVAPTENAYLAGLILPEEEISWVGCDRSFGENGRMQALKGRTWPEETETTAKTPGYRLRPFQVLSVPSEEIAALWRFAKPKPVPCPAASLGQQGDALASVANAKKSRPGNVSAVWTVAPSYHGSSAILVDTGSKSMPNLCRSKTGLYETIINGVKQGNRASSPSARGASSLSRAKLWALFRDIASAQVAHIDQSDALPVELLSNASGVEELHVNTVQHPTPDKMTYQEFKKPSSLEDPLQIRRQAIGDAKLVLKGWMPNTGDDEWGLDVLVDPKKRKRRHVYVDSET